MDAELSEGGPCDRCAYDGKRFREVLSDRLYPDFVTKTSSTPLIDNSRREALFDSCLLTK